MMMKNFNKLYADYMESNNYVNGVIVEYVEGIEVIKAFNQSSSSYEKFTKAVQSFKDYTLKWYQSTWKVNEFYFCGIAFHLPGNAPHWYVSLLDRQPGPAGSCDVPDPLAGDCRPH